MTAIFNGDLKEADLETEEGKAQLNKIFMELLKKKRK